MGILRKLILGLVVFGVVAGGGYYAYTQYFGGQIEKPSVSVADIGDWGEVTENKIAIIHTLNVQNPNPVEVNIGQAITLQTRLNLNGVALGSVEKTGLDISQGNNTVKITSELNQQRIAEFWAAFINADETIHAKLSPSLEITMGPGYSISVPPVRVSALTDARPVSRALEQTGNELEGTYSKEVSKESLPSALKAGALPDVAPSQEVTVEYTIQDVQFEWGKVTPEQTKLLIHITVKNTGETPIFGYPDGVATDILLNDIEVFHARGEAISARNIDRDTVIREGQTKSYTLVATADNQQVEEWFTTFAKRGEKSSVRTEFQLVFSIGEHTISLPQDGGLAYKCAFQTGIFKDEQTTSTTCGENGTIVVGPAQVNVSTLRNATQETEQTPTPTPTPTRTKRPNLTNTPTTTPPQATTTTQEASHAPDAKISANTTSGEAPLTVSFDASESSDPDGDIQEYIWRFKDGSPPGTGETIVHTFRTPGEYQVEVVVVDSAGNRDSATVTITVERKVG